MAPSSTENKIKISNLPLLFAKGNLTSLEMMNLEEIQVFLRFVIKCELSRLEPPDLDTLEKPEWWPTDLEFGERILMKTKEKRGPLSLRLKTAIRNCYSYHKCAFLIDFCRKLVDYTGGVDNLQVIDNEDGTRSMLMKKDKKLLVTFKSENQDYDKYQSVRKPKNQFNAKSPMKTNDPKKLLWTKSDNTSDPAMSNYADIYLCDTCDRDFDSLSLLMDHETMCGDDEIIISDPLATARTPPLFTYLRLRAQGSKTSPPRKLKEQERPKAASYEKFIDIDVASPLGNYIISSSKLRLDQQNPSVRGFVGPADYIKAQEARCPGTIPSLRQSNAYADIRTKFPESRKRSRREAEAWSHQYCFTDLQRRRRLRDIKNGLTLKSLRIWQRCKKREIKLNLERAPPTEVAKVLERYRQEDEKKKELLRKNRADRPGPKSQKRKRNWMDEIPDFKNQLSTVLIPTATSQSDESFSTPTVSPQLPAEKSPASCSRLDDKNTESDAVSDTSDIEALDPLRIDENEEKSRGPSSAFRSGPGHHQNYSFTSFHKTMVKPVTIYQPLDEIETEFKPRLVPPPLVQMQRTAVSRPVAPSKPPVVEFVDLISSDEES